VAARQEDAEFGDGGVFVGELSRASQMGVDLVIRGLLGRLVDRRTQVSPGRASFRTSFAQVIDAS
jgi:hypothetical protein